MNWLTDRISEEEIYAWELLVDDGFFVIALAFLFFEVARYAAQRALSWKLLADALTNYATLAMFIGVNTVLLSGAYVSAYLLAAEFSLFSIPISWASVLAAVLLADIAYYWEHRFAHRVNLAWATHSVHHSSPFFNISVAYRFGPMDGVWPIFFHIPIVLLGFNPFVVFFAEVVVQVYQTALHTESIGKLPRPIEAVLNTPSHHRVHHGANRKYLDANYAGILIIWDRLFGTFVEEDEAVVYGLVKPLDSVNPITAFFHGFWRLIRNALGCTGFWGKLLYFVRPPDWSEEG